MPTLSKFKTLAHTTPLAWNVLPLRTYIVDSFTSLPYFLREALPNHPNQRCFTLASVSQSLSLCSFFSEHLQDVPIGALGGLSGLSNQLGFGSGHWSQGHETKPCVELCTLCESGWFSLPSQNKYIFFFFKWVCT